MRKILMLAACAACLVCITPAYADVKVEGETEAESVAEELSDEERLIEDYLEYAHSLEVSKLTPEEEEAGYQIINGQKYAPEELIGDSASEDVIYGGVQGSSLTGTLTVVANVPEYIHEEVYVHITNMNTYKIYGVRLFEANGYSAQINVPSGVYLISAGGLTADTAARFYLNSSQFLVKRGSIQTLMVTVVDTEPERAEEAYRVEETEPETIGKSPTDMPAGHNTPSDAENETRSPETKQAETDPEEGNGEGEESSWLRILLLTFLFSGMPLGALFIYAVRSQKKNLDD